MAAGVLERPDEHAVRASFHVMRFRNDELHEYVRRYRYRLRSTDNGPQIAYCRATLDADSLCAAARFRSCCDLRSE